MESKYPPIQDTSNHIEDEVTFDGPPIKVEELLREARFELRTRLEAYPRMIASGRYSWAQARRKTQRMAAICRLLKEIILQNSSQCKD